MKAARILFACAVLMSASPFTGIAKPSDPAPAGYAAQRAGDPWRVTSITPPAKSDELPTAVIHFANGRSFRPRLYDPAVIGQLPSTRSAPFLAVGGSDCIECDMTARSIYVGDPTKWPLWPGMTKSLWFAPYPSRNYSQTTRKLMSWSRLFVGRCIGSDQPALVSFAAVRETKSWRGTVDWIQSEGDHLSAHSASTGTPDAPSLAAVLGTVKSGSCREVSAQVTDEGDIG